MALLCAGVIGVGFNPCAQASGCSKRAEMRAYFTPWDDAEGALRQALERAQYSIHVQTYILTSRTIAKALAQAAQRGVRVIIMADAQQHDHQRGSQLGWLATQGVTIRLETLYASAHNKIVLIDAQTPQAVVITGSYNLTYSAQANNAENILFIACDLALTQAYLRNWERHFKDASPFFSESPAMPSHLRE
jgi:phosphatidylserine/phosphatidylglycerophosphate/cardiolipin synthase-like enzyme